MNAITKVSQITAADVAEYLRLPDPTNGDLQTLTNLIAVSKAFIENYTGRTEAELDDFQDFVIVVFVLVEDMWDTRSLYVDKTNLNKVVEGILGLHSVNLL